MAYRRATIALADHIAYVDRGRVAEAGSHAELLDRCTGYRSLVTAYEGGHTGRRTEGGVAAEDTKGDARTGASTAEADEGRTA
ncbi:hypothetical protein ABXI76_32970 [Streptomyces parvus]